MTRRKFEAVLPATPPTPRSSVPPREPTPLAIHQPPPSPPQYFLEWVADHAFAARSGELAALGWRLHSFARERKHCDGPAGLAEYHGSQCMWVKEDVRG